MSNIFLKKGFSLVEVILVVGMIALIAPAITSMALGSHLSTLRTENRLKAIAFAQQGIEAARAIRDYSWNALELGSHGLSDINGYWEFSGVSDVIDGFTRVISVSHSSDYEKDVSVTLSWNVGPSQTTDITIQARFTNWETKDWLQTSLATFDTGQKTNIETTNIVDGELQFVDPPGPKDFETTGDFISSVFDTTYSNASFTTISWSNSGVGNIEFQIRTADTQANLASAVWVGTDGMGGTRYSDPSGTAITIDAGASGTRFIQYRGYFSGDGNSTPVLEDVNISYAR